MDVQVKRTEIEIWYPELPPTANKLYYNGTRLTDHARQYRERFRQHVQQHYGHQLNEFDEPNKKATDENTGKLIDVGTSNPNLIYGLTLIFYMDCVTTFDKLDLTPSKKARFRFVRTDLTNRIKFLEDCWKYAADIDDSLTFFASQMKIHSPEQQGVVLKYSVMPVENFGIRRYPM